MKRLKLSQHETRDWLQNKTFFVEDGKVVRSATVQDPKNKTVRYRTLKKDEYLKEHGDVVLIKCDGTYLTILRNCAVAGPKPKSIKIPSPSECKCSDYSGRIENQHHAACEYRDSWERLARKKPALVVVDSITGQYLRFATPDEAEQYDRTKNAIIVNGNTTYGIVENPEDVP